MREWTEAQKSAIDERSRSLIVSAAAGSGKTATLTERIVRAVCDDGMDISRILAVTFTNAAADEMREKIRKALEEAFAKNPADSRIGLQLLKLPAAHICTIDSFCSDLVHENYVALGLHSVPRTGDEGELCIIRTRAMDDTVDSFYNSADAEVYSSLFDIFTSAKGELNITSSLLRIYDMLMCQPEGIGNLLACTADEYTKFFDTPAGKLVGEITRSSLCAVLGLLRTAKRAEERSPDIYENLIDIEEQQAKKLIDLLDAGDYDGLRRACDENENPALAITAPRGKKGETPASALSKYAHTSFLTKTGVCELLHNKYFYLSEREQLDMLRENDRITLLLHDVMVEFSRRYAAEKELLSVIDFTDIENLAMKLLCSPDGTRTPAAEKISALYDALYMDECQDVNRVQERIFSAVAPAGGCFYVGDVKQSIYRFRGSTPDIFASMIENAPPLADAAKEAPQASVFMQKNFRSDRGILDFTNTVFDILFPRVGFPYNPERDRLVCGKADGLAHGAEECVSLVFADPASGMTEAQYVAAEIKKILSAQSPEADENTKTEPRDIAVLLRSYKPEYAKELEKLGIPVAPQKSEQLFDTPEVLALICLMTAADNPRRDVYLAGALLSPVYGFTLDELVRIREKQKDKKTLIEALSGFVPDSSDPAELSAARKCASFQKSLSELRHAAAELPADRFIGYLLEKTCLSELLSLSAGTRGNSDRISANLRSVHDLARRFESGTQKGLSGFLDYIQRSVKNGKQPDGAKTEYNGVNIITQHASKGLEFKICFVSGCAAPINYRYKTENVAFIPGRGIAFRYRDKTGFAKICTSYAAALFDKTDEDNAIENLCLLYVAATRAMQRLFITAGAGPAGILSRAEAEAEVFSLPVHPKCTPGIKLIAGALAASGWIYGKPQILTAEAAAELRALSAAENAESAPSAPDEKRENTAKDILRDRLSFVYPYEYLVKLPAKLSVSKLVPDLLDADAEPAAALTEPPSGSLTIPAPPSVPRFISCESGKSAADKGTATHLFLQFFDPESLAASGVAAELSRLTDRRFIGEEQAALVDIRELELFARSAFFGRMRRAEKLYREFRFNLFLPASEFSSDPEKKEQLSGRELLVQGVIDCFFYEKGKIYLADYKTDRLSAREEADPAAAAAMLTARHGTQLAYYAQAIEKICGVPPEKTYIYSTRLGREIEINTRRP